MIYIVKYSGQLGFIKPWTATCDVQKTQSMFFLSESILMGIERKLFPEDFNSNDKNLKKIISYKLKFSGISYLQETTRSILPEWESKAYKNSIIKRGVLVNPELYLIFNNKNDAEIAHRQHICLCRNEDVLFPSELIELNNINEFDLSDGYTTIFSNESKTGFVYLGLNKYNNSKQYGKLCFPKNN